MRNLNRYRWCCKRDMPPSGSRNRRSDKRLFVRMARRLNKVATAEARHVGASQ